LLQRQRLNRDYALALLTGYGLMGLTIVVQLTLIPLYLTHLGKERFGVLAMIMAANNYAAIGITWLSGSMARILAERAATGDRAGFAEAYAFSKLVYVAYALIALAGFWVVAPWLLSEALADAEIRTAIMLSCVFFLVSYEYNTDRQALNARHLQARGNLNEVAGQLVFAACVGVGLTMDMGLPGVVGSQVAGMLCTRLLAWLQWKRDDYDLGWKRRIVGIRDLWQRVSGKVGRDYVVYGILLLTLQADALIVGWLAGPKVAADYYLLWRIPEVCILLLLRIPSAYAPHIIAMDARSEHEALRCSYHKGLLAMLGLASAAALVYGVGGHWIVKLWVGDNAPAGFWSYAVAAVAMFFIAFSRWPAEFAFALMNTKPLVRIAALETMAKLALIGLLYGTLGYIAPLVAISLVHALGVFYLYFRLGKNNFTHLGLPEVHR
jgi:O-antigen/teichoic acid export membrane protein